MKKSYGVAASYTGVTARDDTILTVKENELVTVKSVSITLYGGALAENVEAWFGTSYTGAQTFAVAVCHKAETTVIINLYPNVKVLPGERVAFSITMTNANSGCSYSITYDVETKGYTTNMPFPSDESFDVKDCSLLERMLRTC